MAPGTAVVLIHGLPRIGVDPIEQFDAIRPMCRDRGMVETPFCWARPSLGAIAVAARQLTRHDASFALTHAVNLQADVFARLPNDTRILVAAYSLGGAIFYRWVTDVAPPDILDRLDVALMIGAPHAFPDQMRLEQYPDVFLPVRERAIDTREVSRKLAEAGTALKVVLAGQDASIPYAVSAFPPAACLEQVVVPDAGHLSILTHADLVALAGKWLR